MENRLQPGGINLELERRGIKASPVRVLVLRVIKDKKFPMSVQEIESELDTVDRSSITRAMTLFHKAGLVHTIPDGSGSMKYEYCRQEDPGTHSDQHVHFHCERCGSTQCFTSIPVPAVQLPAGYSATSTTYVVSGLCEECSKRMANERK